MSDIMTASAAPVSPARESRFPKRNHDSPISVAAVVRAFFPQKPGAARAEFAGISVRGANLVLDGRNELSGRSIVNLLRSRIGDRVLDALLGERPPAWRAAEVRLMGVAALEAELEQLEQKRRHLEALIERRRE